MEEKDFGINLKVTEKIKKEVKGDLAAVEEENIFATYDHVCKKCGYDKAQIVDLGIWYSDEDNVLRIMCGKCGFTENLNSKVK